MIVLFKQSLQHSTKMISLILNTVKLDCSLNSVQHKFSQFTQNTVYSYPFL